MTTHLSHLVLPRTREAAPLFARLTANPYVEHQVLWEMMGQSADGQRDFLTRCDVTERGFEMYVLSERPVNAPAPWQVRTRVYDPQIKTGALLHFTLRFNPVYAKAVPGKDRGVRTDMVMERYREAEGDAPLMTVAQTVAQDWLGQRQERLGFRIVEVQADNYRRVQPVKRGVKLEPLALLDVQGLLEVRDVDAFLAMQKQGVGKARYAGCGLMLVKRA